MPINMDLASLLLCVSSQVAMIKLYVVQHLCELTK